MRSGIKLAVAVVGMGPSLFSMTGLAEASRNVPWADGYYTPRDQAASCKDPNFESMIGFYVSRKKVARRWERVKASARYQTSRARAVAGTNLSSIAIHKAKNPHQE